MKQSHLELQWRIRPGGGYKSERRYLDFVIDAKSLHDLLDLGDFIGCLGWNREEKEKRHIAMLLLQEKSELESGRIPIYVCAECGELECGAVTVKIDKVADNFVWSDFSFENGYDCTTQTFHQVGPFAFNKTDYWQVLNRRQKHVDSRRQNAIG